MKYKAYLIAILLIIAAPTLKAANNDPYDKEKIARMTEEEKTLRMESIKARAEEIRDMDRSSLTRAEKKALRHELRDLNKEAKAIGRGGVYISLGGILLIILVLILIL